MLLASKMRGLLGRGYMLTHSSARAARSASATPTSFRVVGMFRWAAIPLTYSAVAIPSSDGSSDGGTPNASASFFIFGAHATA